VNDDIEAQQFQEKGEGCTLVQWDSPKDPSISRPLANGPSL
jgi:hypothetical protein